MACEWLDKKKQQEEDEQLHRIQIELILAASRVYSNKSTARLKSRWSYVE